MRAAIFAEMPYRSSSTEARRRQSLNGAMIGATALERGDVLISGDDRLREAVEKHGGKAIHPGDVVRGMW